MIDRDRQMMLAMERFAATVTIPILFEVSSDRVDQFGTGTLIDFDGRLLLVTARHLFDDQYPEKLVIPSSKTKALAGVGPYNLYLAKEKDVDIAILEIKHHVTAMRARESWSVLSVENVASASKNGHFMLAGYPSIKSKHIGGLLGSTLMSLHTERIDPPDLNQEFKAGLDLFFHFNATGETLSGEIAEVPALPGCSGAAVWEYREPDGMRFWTASQCLKMVGIQSAYFPSAGYFRAKSWDYVRIMLNSIEPESAGESV